MDEEYLLPVLTLGVIVVNITDVILDEEYLLPVLALGVTVVNITNVTLDEECLLLVLTVEGDTVVGVTLEEESSLSPVCTCSVIKITYARSQWKT